MFVTAIAVFVTGSVLCGLARTVSQLIAARTFQGIGTGALFVSGRHHLRRGVPPRPGPVARCGGLGALLARELQGRAPSPAATAAATPDVLFRGAPAAAVLVALTALPPRKARHPAPGEATA